MTWWHPSLPSFPLQLIWLKFLETSHASSCYVPKRETGSHFCKTRCKMKWSFMSCPSLKMMTCSHHTEYAKRDDASGPNSIQCSLQVHVQEVHHGTESIDGSVKQRHNSSRQRSRSSGPCGKCLRQCYVNSSTWDRQPCLNCLRRLWLLEGP